MSVVVRRSRAFLKAQWDLNRHQESDDAASFDATLRSVTSRAWRRTKLDDDSLADIALKIRRAFETGDVGVLRSIRRLQSRQCGRTPSSQLGGCVRSSPICGFTANGSRPRSRAEFVFTFSYCSNILDLVSNMPLEWQESYIGEMGARC